MEEVGQCDFHSGTMQSREKSMEYAREKDNRVENSVRQEQMAVNVRKMSMMTCRISGSVYLECSSALLSTFKSVLQFSNQGRCQVCQDVGSAFFSFDLSPTSSCVCTHQQTQTGNGGAGEHGLLLRTGKSDSRKAEVTPGSISRAH